MQPVRDQGQCGSCWAFAAIGVLEGRMNIINSRSLALSEQELVDCGGQTGNNGCSGGWGSRAFQYIQRAGGVALRSAYPYTGRQGSCRASSFARNARISGVSGIADGVAALGSGPTVIYLQAQGAFMSYGGGIFNGVCGQYDHAVIAVGWGTSGSTRFWIVRNSWGTRWGEQGYIRIQMNGNCRITHDSFPQVPRQ